MSQDGVILPCVSTLPIPLCIFNVAANEALVNQRVLVKIRSLKLSCGFYVLHPQVVHMPKCLG